MKTHCKYISLVAILVCLISCNKELLHENENVVKVNAAISAELVTRVSEDGKSFTDGDAITVENLNRSSENVAQYTYSVSSQMWNINGKLFWEGSMENEFRAWYPAVASFDEFIIPTDQSQGTAAADWMTAGSVAKRSDGAVDFNFSHHLSKVVVSVSGWGSEFSESERTLTSVQIATASKTVSKTSLGVAGNSDMVHSFANDGDFYAIVAPGEYPAGSEIVHLKVAGAGTLVVKTKSAIVLESGMAYKYNVRVGRDEIILNASDVTVTDWIDETLDDQDLTQVVVRQMFDYIDEYGVNHGKGVNIDGVIWAPVDCGYHAVNYPYGKLYQWGRKYGQGLSGDYDETVLELFAGPTTLEVGQSPENAAKFITTTTSNDWLSQYVNTLWNTGTEESPEKTEYDPCPDGWRVPTMTELQNLVTHGSGYVSYNNTVGAYFSGTTSYSADADRVFLQVKYMREMYDGTEYIRNAILYWTSTPYETHMGYDYKWDTNYKGITGAARAFGLSVRCVQDVTQTVESETAGFVDLSVDGTANSYIVSEAGAYKFTPVKGNSDESLGVIDHAEVLWESFGTGVAPSIGDLITDVKYQHGVITFNTPATFKEGNALIAAKDASGTILWSWHIWLTDKPETQVYYNDAGVMMDRNLGATSAARSQVGTFGLFYQWGRKDPFLGFTSSSASGPAESTIVWPSSVETSSFYGTVDYTISHPTTFVAGISDTEYDWHYSGHNDLLWASDKTIYDPCPPGWRVPDGGPDGVWAKALGTGNNINGYSYDSTNAGMDFSGELGDASLIWYPMSGYIRTNGWWENLGYAYYASATACDFQGKFRPFNLDKVGMIAPAYDALSRSWGLSVRCYKSVSDIEDDNMEEDGGQSEKTYSLRLNSTTYGWRLSSSVSNPDASLYDGVYESTNNAVRYSQSYMYIDIDGYETFTLYVRSYAESDYDFVVVSNLDCVLTEDTLSGDKVKISTKGNQVYNTSIDGYTEVKFTDIDKGQHTITIMYQKDGTVDKNDDKGYVLIPKNQ